MNSINLDGLIKAIIVVILASIVSGKFPSLRELALKEGIKAATYHEYRPVHFFRGQ